MANLGKIIEGVFCFIVGLPFSMILWQVIDPTLQVLNTDWISFVGYGSVLVVGLLLSAIIPISLINEGVNE